MIFELPLSKTATISEAESWKDTSGHQENRDLSDSDLAANRGAALIIWEFELLKSSIFS